MIPKKLLTKLKLHVSDLERISLSSGVHGNRKTGVCAMEAAAWLAGREHNDHPICVSQSIAAFMRSWNDSLQTDKDRNRLLRPLLPVILETASQDLDIEIRRGWMAMDWLARTMAPAFMDLSPGLQDHAMKLRALPELTSDSWMAAKKIVTAARDAARDAAGDAAGAATWDAARDAAGDAAGAAARDAAGAATWDAAWDAAWKKLGPVVKGLQRNAQALVRRMAELHSDEARKLEE